MTKNAEFLRRILLDAVAKWRADHSTENAGTVMFLAALAAEAAPEVFDGHV